MGFKRANEYMTTVTCRASTSCEIKSRWARSSASIDLKSREAPGVPLPNSCKVWRQRNKGTHSTVYSTVFRIQPQMRICYGQCSRLLQRCNATQNEANAEEHRRARLLSDLPDMKSWKERSLTMLQTCETKFPRNWKKLISGQVFLCPAPSSSKWTWVNSVCACWGTMGAFFGPPNESRYAFGILDAGWDIF